MPYPPKPKRAFCRGFPTALAGALWGQEAAGPIRGPMGPQGPRGQRAPKGRRLAYSLSTFGGLGVLIEYHGSYSPLGAHPGKTNKQKKQKHKKKNILLKKKTFFFGLCFIKRRDVPNCTQRSSLFRAWLALCLISPMPSWMISIRLRIQSSARWLSTPRTRRRAKPLPS